MKQKLNAKTRNSTLDSMDNDPRQPFTRLPGGGALRLLQFLAQGLLALSWGCGREPRHAGAGPNQLHTFLLDEITHLLGFLHFLICFPFLLFSS